MVITLFLCVVYGSQNNLQLLSYLYIYIFNYLILYNQDRECLLRGTQWVLIWNRLHFVSKVLNSIKLMLYSAVLYSYIGYLFYSTLSRTLNPSSVPCSSKCLSYLHVSALHFLFHSLRIPSINMLKRLEEAFCHSWISLYWYINRKWLHFLET